MKERQNKKNWPRIRNHRSHLNDIISISSAAAAATGRRRNGGLGLAGDGHRVDHRGRRVSAGGHRDRADRGGLGTLVAQKVLAILQVLVDGVVLLLARNLQRRQPFGVLGQDVRAGTDQLLDHREVTKEGGRVQGRFAVRDLAQVGAVLEEFVHDGAVALVGRLEEGRGTVLREEGRKVFFYKLGENMLCN